MNSESAPDLSVVIPFYNEEDNIEPLFAELIPHLEKTGRSFEVVGVNDGSQDRTLELLKGISSADPRVRALALRQNSGQTAAFEAGFAAARGRYIVTMDGDLQIDPQDVGPMVDTLEKEGVDFVYGWRKKRQDTFVRVLSTKIANGVRDWLTGEKIPDTGCPLKVFKAEILKRMKLFDGMHRFFITLAHIDGYTSTQMVVHHRARQHGESKYGIRNRVLKALRDTFAVRWMRRRHLRYEVDELG